MNAIQDQPLREISQYLRIPAGDVHLMADLHIPVQPHALMVLAGSGRCRNNPRTRHAARIFRENGIGTLCCDLLTDEEADEEETYTEAEHDATMLADRLIAVTHWLAENPETEEMQISYFGSCVGGAAALIAAASLGDRISVVISRGGRLDLAAASLPLVQSPTLLLVGEDDDEGLQLSHDAMPLLTCEKELRTIPGATHLFGEPGALDAVVRMSILWLSERMHIALIP